MKWLVREFLVFPDPSFVFPNSVSRSSSTSEFMLCAGLYLFKVATLFRIPPWTGSSEYQLGQTSFFGSVSGQDGQSEFHKLPGSASLARGSYQGSLSPSSLSTQTNKKQGLHLRQVPWEQIITFFLLPSTNPSNQCLILGTVPSCSRQLTKNRFPGWPCEQSPWWQGPCKLLELCSGLALLACTRLLCFSLSCTFPSQNPAFLWSVLVRVWHWYVQVSIQR